MAYCLLEPTVYHTILELLVISRPVGIGQRTVLYHYAVFLSIFFLSPYMWKGKGHPRTDHEVAQREYKYSSTLSLTSALDGVSVQSHAPAALPPGMTRYPLYRRLGGPSTGPDGCRKSRCPPPFPISCFCRNQQPSLIGEKR
jgi:hypothetical protein